MKLSLPGRTARRSSTGLCAEEHPGATVVVPSDLLFQLHQTLFPAERMALIAAREVRRDLYILGAPFDVTSSELSHVAYARADPASLARSLIAMDSSGTRLGAWAHSHPGVTATATHPSAIDRRQWTAWSADFKNLLGLILTTDGHVRLWGESLETGQLKVNLIGQGLEEIEQHVYRLTL